MNATHYRSGFVFLSVITPHYYVLPVGMIDEIQYESNAMDEH